MIALVRFHISAYVRTTRVLHPCVALLLLLVVVFTAPLGADPRQGVLTAFGDLAVLTFPIYAWAARGLLDADPDAQRHICAVVAGRGRSVVAGLLAAYACCACLAVAAAVMPVVLGVEHDVGFETIVAGAALLPLSALAATMAGALTGRVILPSPGMSVLALLGGFGALLLLGLGPLRFISVPMIEWMRAANAGPHAFIDAFPALAGRMVAWSAVVGACYLRLRGTRP